MKKILVTVLAALTVLAIAGCKGSDTNNTTKGSDTEQKTTEQAQAFDAAAVKASIIEKVTFDKVLLLSDGDKVKVGTPTVKSAKVEATVLEHGKAKKILVYKYKAKKNERKTQGHRQPYTKIKIEKISQRASSKKAAATEIEAAE